MNKHNYAVKWTGTGKHETQHHHKTTTNQISQVTQAPCTPLSAGSYGKTTNNNRRKKLVRIASARRNKRHSFNIFDGTDVAGANSGPFGNFVFEGDESDFENDDTESRFWAGCQNVNNSQRSERKISFAE